MEVEEDYFFLIKFFCNLKMSQCDKWGISMKVQCLVMVKYPNQKSNGTQIFFYEECLKKDENFLKIHNVQPIKFLQKSPSLWYPAAHNLHYWNFHQNIFLLKLIRWKKIINNIQHKKHHFYYLSIDIGLNWSIIYDVSITTTNNFSHDFSINLYYFIIWI